MKTTVEISDDVLVRAKRVASAEGTTLRDLIERGLRRELAERAEGSYVLIDGSFAGTGTQPGVTEGDWATMRGLIYEGRGA